MLQLDDSELLHVCHTENDHRGNLFLRKTVGHDPPPPSAALDGEGPNRSMQKISKFFGVEPSAPSTGGMSPAKKRNLVVDPSAVSANMTRSTSLFSPTIPINARLDKSKLNKFFGERPPDELIVDQLEQFFPGIGAAKELDSAKQLKTIVQANLLIKRSSRRASSLMQRRQTSQLPSRESARPRPQAVLVKKSDLSISTIIKEGGSIEDISKIPEPLMYVVQPIPTNFSVSDSPRLIHDQNMNEEPPNMSGILSVDFKELKNLNRSHLDGFLVG